ncbi:MAG: helix-turn-helix domain-containing protein, partial [Firmicutes bacterium]|nr:helix-turn-helix domain-containing protein [Bacillota bacterium]
AKRKHVLETATPGARLFGLCATSAGVIEYEGILNNAQMIGRITSKGTNIAYLAMLDAAKPFSETDYELVPIICDVLSIIMQSQEKLSVATSEIESLVIDILNNSHDQRYISEKINSSQLQPIDELCLVCIGADQALDSTQKMVFVKSLMQYFFVGSTSVVYSGNVLIMIEYKRNHLLFTEGKIADFKQLLVSHNLHAGVSRPFYRLSDIKLHYKQALNAIITARMINHGELLYFYEDYFFHYLVKSFLESNSLHNICLPQLLELIKRDKEKSSSYSISLYRYLQNNGDIKATSRAMHLHYNTMKYRLQKISDVMEVDLKDYDLLLKCKLSFLALEIYHKVNFTDYFEQVRIPEET